MILCWSFLCARNHSLISKDAVPVTVVLRMLLFVGCQNPKIALYYPQNNSVVELLSRTLGNLLRALVIGLEHKGWDRLMPQMIHMYDPCQALSHYS